MPDTISKSAILLLAIGGGVNVAASIWFRFACYSADIYLARWSQILPILSIRLAVENPRKCLAPFVLQHVGMILGIPFLLQFSGVFNAIHSGGFQP